jgi:SAM-dependent methyltransferase
VTDGKQQEHVRDYFDYDSVQYRKQRYPDEPKTCDQYSYLTRKRYVLEMLDQDRRDRRGKILDIGCGPGIYATDLLTRGWDVWGIDLSPKMIEAAEESIADLSASDRDRAHFSVGQVGALPFDPIFFDAVICIGVISYLEKLEHSLSDILRVLKPGGTAILQLSNKLSPFEAEVGIRRGLKSLVKMWRNSDPDEKLVERFRCTPYIPRQFDQTCVKLGFTVRDFRYYDFRLPLLTRLMPETALSVGKKMESLSRSLSLGWLGACYLVKLAKK